MQHFYTNHLSLTICINSTIKAPVWQMKIEWFVCTIPIIGDFYGTTSLGFELVPILSSYKDRTSQKFRFPPKTVNRRVVTRMGRF